MPWVPNRDRSFPGKQERYLGRWRSLKERSGSRADLGSTEPFRELQEVIVDFILGDLASPPFPNADCFFDAMWPFSLQFLISH